MAQISRRRPRRRRGGRALAVTAALVLAIAACGGSGADDPPTRPESSDQGDGAAGAGSAGGAPAEPVTLDRLAADSGDAPAATGAGLTQPPGADRRSGLSDGDDVAASMGEVAASITAADGTVTGCCLLVAASARQRQRGLMEVTDLGGYQGMVFVWDDDVVGGFWMRNTPTPLSIAWFDADGAFVSATDMAPCSATADDCPTYDAEGQYRFAVEVLQGDLEGLGVGPGSRLALGGGCAGVAGRG